MFKVKNKVFAAFIVNFEQVIADWANSSEGR